MNTDPTEIQTDIDASDPEPVEDPRDPGEPSLEDDQEGAHPRPFWKELPVLIIVALLVAVLIKTFLVQAFFIPSASMRGALIEGDRVMVNKLAFRFGDPAPGDVVVFDSPLEDHSSGENLLEAIVRNIGESLGLSTPETALIKRVIAVGGDTIEIRDNAVLVNGVELAEDYLTKLPLMSDFGPVEIPPDEVFVMGDNRGQSEDSRSFGPIPVSSVIGRAFVRVWPPGRWGGL